MNSKLFDILNVEYRGAWDHIDLSWMIETYPEISDVIKCDSSPSFDYILQLSGNLGYSPNPYFDELYYISRYPDIQLAIANGEYFSGFDHYRSVGFRDRNPHWLFNEEYYLSKNADVGRSLVNNGVFRNGYDHYIQCGDEEFRTGSWFFDPLEYIKSTLFQDVKKPFTHYVHSKSKYSNTEYFDTEYYINKYPHVIDEVKIGKWKSILHHYLYSYHGGEYNPNPYFSESFYIQNNPDLVTPIRTGQFINGYNHFLIYGIRERRSPHPDIDLEKFYHHSYIQNLLFNGRVPDVYIAWCRFKGIAPIINENLEKQELETKIAFEAKSSMVAINSARKKIAFVCDNPIISVIIVVHNNFDMTLNSLNSLRACYDGQIDLLLADSGSYDETSHIEDYIEGAKILKFHGNVGFIRACNEAVKHARAPFLLFLNNDTEIQRGSIEAAINRFKCDKYIGVVGAKLLRTNGLLQEAGSIIYRDGSVAGYMRGENPNCPEANFVRRVDFCSGACFFTKTDLFRQVNGFDEDYIPAYYEETDYCVRLWKMGYETVYDPSISAIHYEYGTSNLNIGSEYISRNRIIFNSKHAKFLSDKFMQSKLGVNSARTPQKTSSKRILFIEDRIPLKSYGSGFARSHDIISAMAALGHEVTIFPIYKPTFSINRLYNSFHDTVEVIWDRDLNDLEQFLTHRSGSYDIIWICRTQNVRRLLPVIERIAHLILHTKIIADTEAVSAVREDMYDRLKEISDDRISTLNTRLRTEFECLFVASKIVAVNNFDMKLLSENGFDNIEVLGHTMSPNITLKSFDERRDLLFVGAIHEYNSPNYDSVMWLANILWPALEKILPEDVRLIVAGHLGPGVSFSGLPETSRITYLGEVEDLTTLYNSARFFIAPTRYAGGIPYKVYEAASFGLPVIASDILCNQMEWSIGKEILEAKTGNSQSFCDVIEASYNDASLWACLRFNAAERLMTENTASSYAEKIQLIIH